MFLSVSLSDICCSLSSERALVSPSECAAIVFATMECLRFLLLQNAGEEPEQRSIQSMLISEQVSGSRAGCIRIIFENNISVKNKFSLTWLNRKKLCRQIQNKNIKNIYDIISLSLEHVSLFFNKHYKHLLATFILFSCQDMIEC